MMLNFLMNKMKMPGVKKSIALADELGVKFIACTTTMALMGMDKDSIIPEVKTFAGVATYIDEARQSEINLFI